MPAPTQIKLDLFEKYQFEVHVPVKTFFAPIDTRRAGIRIMWHFVQKSNGKIVYLGKLTYARICGIILLYMTIDNDS